MVKYLLLFPYFCHLFSFVFHVSQTSTSIMFPWWNWDVDEMLEACKHQHHQHEMHARNKQQPTNIGNVSLAVGPGPWTELFIVSLRALEVSLWFAMLTLPAMCSRPLRIHQQHGVRKNSPQGRHSSLAQLLKAWSNSVVAASKQIAGNLRIKHWGVWRSLKQYL